MAIDFLRTGDFYPRLKHLQVQCFRRSLPPHVAYGPRNIRDRGYRCTSLGIPLHTVSNNGSQTLFQHKDVRIGNWAATEPTHFLFDQMVQLFCMAEKYGWTELMDISMRKIDVFPIDPRALATLAANCGCLEADLLDPRTSSKAGLLRLLDDASDFHQSSHE